MQTLSGIPDKRVPSSGEDMPISDCGDEGEINSSTSHACKQLSCSWQSLNFTPKVFTERLAGEAVDISAPLSPPGLPNTQDGEADKLTGAADRAASVEAVGGATAELADEDGAMPVNGGERVEPSAGESFPVARGTNGNEAGTAMSLYLREIGQVKLLTPEEELALAARIKAGDKKAREQMIKANLRLVVKIARDYEGVGLPLLDLISEGNIGLMKAVERFDPAKGAKLSTYAAWWIKQSMKRALATQSKTIRLPVHMVDKISRMRRSAIHLHEELGREPTDEELAEEMGTTARRVGEMRMAALPPTSLDAPINGDDSMRFSEVVEDEKADSPYEHLKTKTVAGMLRDMVKVLSSREALLVRARFGLDGNPCRTLDEVGEQLGVTRERVRQLQNNALAKLRKMIQRREAVRA
jgi:RNA polymerase primary sigma factor